MTVWTPATTIKVKVLGLAWRGEELLVAEVEDSAGRVKGVRPLGGCVEFGETREQALSREFEEELGCSVRVTGPWHGFENIYEHEGALGHEFLFAADILLSDPGLYERSRFRFLESDETDCWAAWVSPLSLPSHIALYPSALLQLISAGQVGGMDRGARA